MGIETSCDETAVAIVDSDKKIHANLVLSQLEEHEGFGGVVPEIAARAHLDNLDKLIKSAMHDAGFDFKDLDGIAATCGPGLIGGVMVGMMAGKAIAAAHNKPFIAVNHLEAHALTARLCEDIAFPYLVLLVSGGHTQFLIAEGVGQYTQLGATLDDALGECFDKSAKLMGLPFPGGPHLEKAALQCADPAAALKQFPLPRPLKGRKDCNFSFSGLKTAVRTQVHKLPEGDLQRDDVTALAYAFQDSVADVVKDRCKNAISEFMKICGEKTKSPTLVVCGGVAANKVLRAALKDLTSTHNMAFSAPAIELCSDNGAMIAWAGLEKLRLGHQNELNVAARPRWPLEDLRKELNQESS